MVQLKREAQCGAAPMSTACSLCHMHCSPWAPLERALAHDHRVTKRRECGADERTAPTSICSISFASSGAHTLARSTVAVVIINVGMIVSAREARQTGCQRKRRDDIKKRGERRRGHARADDSMATTMRALVWLTCGVALASAQDAPKLGTLRSLHCTRQ